MQRRFATLDVFTLEPLAGNPLAVVRDSEGLNDAAMQRIAREFNLSETVFLLPPDEPNARARLRIFTPARELPFAGHPTVGTAVLLGLADRGGQHGHIAFDLTETVGTVPCAVEVLDGRSGRATFTLPRLPQEAGTAPNDIALASALSLKPGDLGFDRHVPSVWSGGNAFLLVPVAGRDALARAEPAGHELLGDTGTYIYTRETGAAEHHFRARMFGHGSTGVVEDPATGSAVAAFAGALVAHEALEDGQHHFVIEQGFEMGRPSLIELDLTVEGGALVHGAIGGGAVVVSEGHFSL